jgi:hypothetical protein
MITNFDIAGNPKGEELKMVVSEIQGKFVGAVREPPLFFFS